MTDHEVITQHLKNLEDAIAAKIMKEVDTYQQINGADTESLTALIGTPTPGLAPTHLVFIDGLFTALRIVRAASVKMRLELTPSNSNPDHLDGSSVTVAYAHEPRVPLKGHPKVTEAGLVNPSQQDMVDEVVRNYRSEHSEYLTEGEDNEG